jgi:hypothetical protein
LLGDVGNNEQYFSDTRSRVETNDIDYFTHSSHWVIEKLVLNTLLSNRCTNI